MRTFLTIILLCLLSRGYAQVDTIRWNQLSPLPDGIQRIGAGYFLIDSDFYVAGGQLGVNTSSTNAVWQYHIPTDSWFQKSNLPFGSSSCGASFVLNNKGYFLASRDSVSNDNCDTMFWEYDPSGDTWARKTGFPDGPRQDAAYFTYGEKGYVGETNGCQSTDSHFWQYDPTVNQWSEIATLSGAELGGSVSTVSPTGSVYLFGGYNFDGNSLKDIWHYNIASNIWDSIGQMPGQPRSFAVFWNFDGISIGGGGEVTDSNLNIYLGYDYYSFDISRNLWKPIIFLNSFDSTAGGATFIYEKKGYYFGGLSSINPNYICSNQMWSFDASKYLTDTATGIAAVRPDVSFSLYPDPVPHDGGFSISTSESGEVVFYDALGRTLDEYTLTRGINRMKLHTDSEVIFYRATLHSGTIEYGKVVVY